MSGIQLAELLKLNKLGGVLADDMGLGKNTSNHNGDAKEDSRDCTYECDDKLEKKRPTVLGLRSRCAYSTVLVED